MPDPQLSLQGRIGAATKWSREDDPSAATAPARAAFMERFERQVDPDSTLAPDERAKRAKHARNAYFLDLARRSAEARRRRAGLAELEDLAAELRAAADDLSDGAA